MARKNKHKLNPRWSVLIIVLALIELGLVLAVLLHGKNVALFNPQGLIAQEQNRLIVLTAGILLGVAVPVVLLLYFTAWKYRESNSEATYETTLRRPVLFNFSAWAFPVIVMLILTSIMWPATHRLEPRKVIASDAKPLKIQVISMRWKWLFLYPDQKIATVNYLQIPVNTPIEFDLTADEAPMSSFWIPNLGGQLYSMTGHVNRLNLMATKAGVYTGSSAELNGSGFADMKFTANVGESADFESWVQEIKQSPEELDTTAYKRLVQPSENNPAAFYSHYQNDLYDTVVMKYMGPSEGHMEHK